MRRAIARSAAARDAVEARGRSALPLLAAAVLGVLLLSGRASAIPAFARKYETSCTTCHVGFPKLNDFGEAFRRNGFQMPAEDLGTDEEMVKDQPIAIGSEGWKKVFPDAVWPATIPHLPPISLMARLDATQEEGSPTKFNLKFPDLLAFLAGGTIGQDISFFVHFGAGTRAYVQFSNLLDSYVPEHLLNVELGLFEPGTVAFSNERRLTITPYLFSTYSITFPNGDANTFEFDRQMAAEVNGIFLHRLSYAVGVTPGTGDAPSSDNRWGVYYRVAGKLFGMPFDGPSTLGNALVQSENYTDNSVTIGQLGYFGSRLAKDVSQNGAQYTIDFRRIGFDLRANFWRFDVFGGVLLGRDVNADNQGFNTGSFLYFAEVDAVVFPWWLVAVRGERLDFGEKRDGLLDSQEIRRLTASTSVFIRANIRATVEGRFDERGGGRAGGDALLLRLEYAF